MLATKNDFVVLCESIKCYRQMGLRAKVSTKQVAFRVKLLENPTLSSHMLTKAFCLDKTLTASYDFAWCV
jgi:hypothetical protein